jgi:phosphate transport system substrate-binding protein
MKNNVAVFAGNFTKYLLLLVIFVFSCKEQNKKDTKASTLGQGTIWVDKSIRKIVAQEEEVFELAYKYADLTVNYVTEMEALTKFYKDSADVIIISHAIDTNELKKFNSKKLFPRQFQFATSAIAFVTSKESTKRQFTYDEITKLLESNDKTQTFVIESSGAGVASDLLKHIKSGQFGTNVYAQNSKGEVIDYVLRNKNSIGVIDWSELSDNDDKEALALREKIQLIQISGPNTNGKFVDATQYNLNGLYPFTRDLYIIRKFGYNDVSLGFASFVCGERGQKIVLKAGLLPKYQSERWIEFGELKDVKVIK